MKKYLKLFFALLVLLIILTGCKDKEEAKQDVEEPDTEEEPVVEEEEPKFTFPLTGIETDKESTDRTIAVMINNHPDARPQSGLHKADIIFEVLAEGGVTRFLALFQSEQPENIGPVRSARHYYIQLASGYNALYVHHGWSPQAQELILSGFIDTLNGLYYDGTLFQRASFRVAPHNSYITYENILKGAEQNNYEVTSETPKYTFLDEDGDVSGTDHVIATINYSTNQFESRFEYDTATEAYNRYSSNGLMVDLETNEKIVLNNVLIIETTHTVLDDAGRLDVDVTSGGRAYLLQKGKYREVEWKNVDGRITPYLDGTELPLVPGKTWISIVPDLNKVSFQ